MGFFDNLKKNFNKVKTDVTKSVKKKYKQIQDKNALVDSLTIKEKEKVYRDWISKSLKITISEKNSKGNYVEKTRSLTPNELSRKIKFNLTADKILKSVPRLNKKVKEVKKSLKK